MFLLNFKEILVNNIMPISGVIPIYLKDTSGFKMVIAASCV